MVVPHNTQHTSVLAPFSFSHPWAIATSRPKDKYYGLLGWLVIENNGDAAPWQQFLALDMRGVLGQESEVRIFRTLVGKRYLGCVRVRSQAMVFWNWPRTRNLKAWFSWQIAQVQQLSRHSKYWQLFEDNPCEAFRYLLHLSPPATLHVFLVERGKQ